VLVLDSADAAALACLPACMIASHVFGFHY
jgi:hypothetical protein